MRSRKINYLLCLIITLTALLGGLTYGQEISDKYYHYDLKIDEFRSLPFRTFKVSGKIPNNYLSKGDIISRKNILKTSYYDENHPAVMVESSYKILDIVEVASKYVYVATERQDKIVKVFEKEEYNNFVSSFKSFDVSLRYLPDNYDSFNKVFENTGVKDSLNKQSEVKVQFFKDYIDSLNIVGYSQGDLNFQGYETPIGNIVSGKYLVEQKDLKKSNPEFCKLISSNDTEIRRLNAQSLDIVEKYSSFYGDQYIPSMDFLSASDYFEYVNKQDFTFSSKFEFDKFLKDNGLQSKLKIDSFTGKTFRIYKKFKVRDNGSIKSEETYIKDVTYELNSNYAPFNIVYQAIKSYGVRVRFNNHISMKTIADYNPNVYANENGQKIVSNKYGYYNLDESISNVNGSIIYEEYDKYRTVTLAETALNTMSDYQLGLIGIVKNKKLPIKTKDSAFHDLYSGDYLTGNYSISIPSCSDYMIAFNPTIDERFTQLFKGNDTILNNNKDYVSGKLIDSINHITYYSYESGLLIDSYPWGFIIRDKENIENNKVFYKIPKYMEFTLNPFANPVQTAIKGHVSYWDLNDYYKGDVSFVNSNNGVTTVDKYKLLEGNENFTVDNNIVKHKARKLDDNSIINIELHFEDQQIKVISY